MSFEVIKKYDDAEKLIKLYLIGDLDIYTAPDFKTEIESYYNDKKSSILIDAQDLEYIDSTGLGALLYVLKEVHADGNKIMIDNMKKNIRKIFSITKLDEMFEVRGTENE